MSPLGVADSPTGSSSGDGGGTSGGSGRKRKVELGAGDDTDGDSLSPRKQSNNNNDVAFVLLDGSESDIDVSNDVVVSFLRKTHFLFPQPGRCRNFCPKNVQLLLRSLPVSEKERETADRPVCSCLTECLSRSCSFLCCCFRTFFTRTSTSCKSPGPLCRCRCMCCVCGIDTLWCARAGN